MPHCDSAATAAAQRRISVTYRSTSSLTAYDRNARTHSDEQVRQIRASIDEFGFTNPILLRDDGATIGAGHGRWAAAQLEPAIAEVPTITLDGLSDAEWRAYVIADNKLYEMGGWDEELLAAEAAEILSAGPDLGDLMGFAAGELEALVGSVQTPAVGGGAQPSFNYQEQFGVVVICAGETEQQAVFERLTGEGLDCRVVVT